MYISCIIHISDSNSRENIPIVSPFTQATFASFSFAIFTQQDSCEIVVAMRARERGCYHLGYKHLIFRGVDSYPSGKAGTSLRAAVPSCYLRHVANSARGPRTTCCDPASRDVDPRASIRVQRRITTFVQTQIHGRDHGRDKSFYIRPGLLSGQRYFRKVRFTPTR